MNNIHQWNEISNSFKQGLILGNGASIAVHGQFNYKNLFQNAIERGFISEDIEKIFSHLETEDFELVLKLLWHTYSINQALDIQDGRTNLAYQLVRDALIKAVREIHINYDDVKENDLPNIASFLRGFKTIVSLNYDLLVYWAMMYNNDQIGQEKIFKDCFLDSKFRDDWQFFRKPHRREDPVLVFYPHGNLSLVTNIFGEEIKVKSNKRQLLETIISKWERGSHTPLFVSEGNSEQKASAIQRSPYLRTVYQEVLRNLGSNIAIYGWSMNDQDQHILKAISQGRNKVKALAISVRTNSGSIEEKCNEITKKVKTFLIDPELEIIFFDSASEGCWVNSPCAMAA
ncbi:MULTISPECIES: DUF4917 family protein [Trichocoleus]|uniref:DUF4917 family protein n=1 Tax=Trichocoleus desertorum GB2-A4 TaxID=2933944 RepID=A0ABV0JEW2_9CYAN|nr:DUF4917 family protein [Trichocoleus sp. FACHB-46]MBD1865113.1 DUF4917 family protein [Trichocoleus sp. FACHB-46]